MRKCLYLLLDILFIFSSFATCASRVQDDMFMYAYEKIILEWERKIEACEALYYDICERQSDDWLEMFLYYSAQSDLFEYWFGGKYLPFDTETIEKIRESDLPDFYKETLIAGLNIEARDELYAIFPYEMLRDDDGIFLQYDHSSILNYYAGRIVAEIYSDDSLAYMLMEKAMNCSIEQNDYVLTAKVIEDMASLLMYGTQYVSVSDYICMDCMEDVYPSLNTVTKENVARVKKLLDTYNDIWKPSISVLDRTELIPYRYMENYIDISLQMVYYYCTIGEITTAGYYLDQLKNRLFRINFNSRNLDGYRLFVSGLEVVTTKGNKNKYEVECDIYETTIKYNESVRENLSFIEDLFPTVGL